MDHALLQPEKEPKQYPVTIKKSNLKPPIACPRAPRYNLAPLEGLELLGRSLYQSAPFEYREQDSFRLPKGSLQCRASGSGQVWGLGASGSGCEVCLNN